MKVIEVECESPPPIAVTVALYVPGAEPLQERDEAPKMPSVMVVGVSEQTSPLEGETEVVRTTGPVKPSRLTTMIVVSPACPELTVRPFVPDKSTRSISVKATAVLWERTPLLPVRVTV